MSRLFHQQTPVSFGFSSFQEVTTVMSCSLPSFNSVGLWSHCLFFFFLIYFADWLLAFPSPSCNCTFYIWSQGHCFMLLQLHQKLQTWLHFRAENIKYHLLWESGYPPQLDHQNQKQTSEIWSMHLPPQRSANTNDRMCMFIMNSSERDGVLRMTLWRKSRNGHPMRNCSLFWNKRRLLNEKKIYISFIYIYYDYHCTWNIE